MAASHKSVKAQRVGRNLYDYTHSSLSFKPPGTGGPAKVETLEADSAERQLSRAAKLHASAARRPLDGRSAVGRRAAVSERDDVAARADGVDCDALAEVV